MFKELLACFSELDDPRVEHKTVHQLSDILAIAICAVLASAESFEDIALYGRCKQKWLSEFLDLPGGIPSHDTFRRIFMIIGTETFEQCFLTWTRSVFRCDDDAPPHIAVDGKTMRRSFDRKREQSPLHVVSAFATQSGLVLAQRVVADKSGELSVLPELLEGLNLCGTLVSLDALACTKGVASEIVGRGGDYLIALKGNQKKVHRAVKDWFSENAFQRGAGLRPDYDAFDDSHGRTVRRRVFVCADPAVLPDLASWPDISKIIAVENIRSIDNTAPGASHRTTCEIRYYITSSKDAGTAIAAAIRNHWAIENSLHWVLDVGFREDECRVRNRNAANNLAVLRKIVINLIRKDKTRKGSLKGKRKTAGWDNEYMLQIITS